ncbi:MAG: DMT family transporter [Helicobacteraceae bacterium]|nr:DMT family transporter [Helicobacteraceae bacterium]
MQNVFTLLLFVAMVFWGLSWPLSKILSATHSAYIIAFGRFGLVALCLLPLLFYFKISLKIPKKNIPIMIINAISNASYSLVFFYALKLGNAGSAGVITTTLSPIIATFLAVIIFGNKLSKREIFGLLLGLMGGFFLLNLVSLQSLLNPFNLFFIFCAFLWACVSLSARKLSSNTNPLLINFYSSFISALMFIPFIKLGDLEIFRQVDSLCFLLIIAILSTVFGTTIYYKGIEVLGIIKSGAFTLLVPFFALILSYFILDEIPSFSTIFGGILAISAIYFISFYNKKHFAFFKI